MKAPCYRCEQEIIVNASTHVFVRPPYGQVNTESYHFVFCSECMKEVLEELKK